MVFPNFQALSTPARSAASVVPDAAALGLQAQRLNDSEGNRLAQFISEKLEAMGIHKTERNLNNKISRGGFTAAFFLQCLKAIGSQQLRLD